MRIKELTQTLKTCKKPWTFVIWGSVFVLLICVSVLVWQFAKRKKAEDFYLDVRDNYVSERPISPNGMLQDSQEGGNGGFLEVDFESLQKVNPHIYAWIEIPGTEISYPVVQHNEDDTYYLNHTVEHKQGLPGSLFSEMYTSKYFIDNVHIIYGHNMKNKSMFGSLHNYGKEGFLEKNSYIYLYTSQGTFVYRIFAAIETGQEHLLAKYSFSSIDGREKYLEDVYNPEHVSQKNHYLEGVNVTPEQKYLILSTCISGKKELRYTIHAALQNIME